MRRDNHLLLRKIPEDGLQYHSIALKFTRDFLREFYQHLKQREIPKNAVRSRGSLYLLSSNRDDIRILFESLIQYFDAETKPSDEILRLKMVEGLYAILKTDENLYASLFDFVDRWKIDIMAFLEKNYMNDLTLRDIARFTGRSLSTFKRPERPDAATVAHAPPSGSCARDAAPRQQTRGHGCMLRSGVQEPVALLETIQTHLRHTSHRRAGRRGGRRRGHLIRTGCNHSRRSYASPYKSIVKHRHKRP